MVFVKGQSGNPGGRKKSPITTELEKIAKEVLPEGVTKAEALARVLWKRAMEGDNISLKYVADRLDGSPVQAIHAEVTERRPVFFSGSHQGLVNAPDE